MGQPQNLALQHYARAIIERSLKRLVYSLSRDFILATNFLHYL